MAPTFPTWCVRTVFTALAVHWAAGEIQLVIAFRQIIDLCIGRPTFHFEMFLHPNEPTLRPFTWKAH